jgi:hypothetical protein
MDQELRDYLDERFKSIDERFDRVETGVRENRVLIEGLDGKVQLVAEGVANGNESRERFQQEVAKEFKDVRSTMDLHFSHLDRRLKKLERPRRSRKQPVRASSG